MGRCFSRFMRSDDENVNDDYKHNHHMVHSAAGSVDPYGTPSQRYVVGPEDPVNFVEVKGMHHALAAMENGNKGPYRTESSPSTFFREDNSLIVFNKETNSITDSRLLNNNDMRNRHYGDNNGSVKVIAIYDYDSQVDGDISFRKGDVMILNDSRNADWWYVTHPKYGSGYAPRNFLAPDDSLECEEWFAGRIQRSLAEKLVSANNMPRGGFLIRKRDTSDEYAVTINDSRDGVSFDVKHYKIRSLDGGFGYFITTRKVFSSIPQLVAFYSMESGGLCYRLTTPARRLVPIRTDLSHDTQKNWEIPREELQLLEKLGDGNFGEVWYGKWRGVVKVAIKTMKAGSMTVDAFLAEAQIMKQCNHPKLVKLYAVCTNIVPYYIVTEFMVNGSLLHFLRREGNSLGRHALVDMCSQVANGMMYLESRRLVHRDLAARNVLVGEKISGIPEVKVADFGLARKLVDENTYESQTGAKFPIKWTAPEAATSGNFTVKSDVWSYGILVYEVFTYGHTPYPGMQNREVIEHLEQGYRMPKPHSCPEPVYLEMLKCWDAKPEKRPTFEHLFAFFDDYFVSSQPNYVPPSVDGVPAITTSDVDKHS